MDENRHNILRLARACNVDGGISGGELCAYLNVNRSTLYAWVRRAREAGLVYTSGTKRGVRYHATVRP